MARTKRLELSSRENYNGGGGGGTRPSFHPIAFRLFPLHPKPTPPPPPPLRPRPSAVLTHAARRRIDFPSSLHRTYRPIEVYYTARVYTHTYKYMYSVYENVNEVHWPAAVACIEQREKHESTFPRISAEKNNRTERRNRYFRSAGTVPKSRSFVPPIYYVHTHDQV